MTEEERLAVVASVVIAGMWGHGGVADMVLKELDKSLPGSPRWSELSRTYSKDIRRARIGVLDDEATLRTRLMQGYWLVNYDEDGCSLFNPPPMNGLSMYVSKRLAGKFPSPYANISAPSLQTDLQTGP